eukprot:COSAG05_NODE_119_length_17779_cov_273.146049_10_plen_69_part_00
MYGRFERARPIYKTIEGIQAYLCVCGMPLRSFLVQLCLAWLRLPDLCTQPDHRNTYSSVATVLVLNSV